VSTSQAERIVVIGASAAGLKAAARCKRVNPAAEITVLDERSFISYGACGLPYFLSSDVETLDHLRQTGWGATRDADFFAHTKGLEVVTGVRVTGLDPGARKVIATEHGPDGGDEIEGDGAENTYPYDKLVISTGAEPCTLPGVEIGGNVSFFHTAEQARSLRQGLETGQIGSAVVIGAGFVGLEVAVALAELWGCEVTVIEAADRVLPQLLDGELARVVDGHLRENNVTVVTGAPVSSATSTDSGVDVEASGQNYSADRAVLAVGVQPRTGFAGAAGLENGATGALKVDDRLQTNLPGVFAAGDCVEIPHALTGTPVFVPLGSLANRQGRVVGDNLAGLESRFGPVVGSACVKVFELNVAATGLTETAARRAGLAARAICGTFKTGAHFYPDQQNLHLKLVYETDTLRLLGLQAVGEGDTVKRVDVFASLLQRGGTLMDLLDLETCYSPPYNSALDPLHGLGCAALNQEQTGILGVEPFSAAGDRFVLDVRSADEVEVQEPVPGNKAGASGSDNTARAIGVEAAVNIPLEELRARVDEIPRERPLLVLCAMGVRSAEAARWLAAQGYDDVIYLSGGMRLRERG